MESIKAQVRGITAYLPAQSSAQFIADIKAGETPILAYKEAVDAITPKTICTHDSASQWSYVDKERAACFFHPYMNKEITKGMGLYHCDECFQIRQDFYNSKICNLPITYSSETGQSTGLQRNVTRDFRGEINSDAVSAFVCFFTGSKVLTFYEGRRGLSLPGGKRKKWDKTILDTAFREVEEEIGEFVSKDDLLFMRDRIWEQKHFPLIQENTALLLIPVLPGELTSATKMPLSWVDHQKIRDRKTKNKVFFILSRASYLMKQCPVWKGFWKSSVNLSKPVHFDEFYKDAIFCVNLCGHMVYENGATCKYCVGREHQWLPQLSGGSRRWTLSTNAQPKSSRASQFRASSKSSSFGIRTHRVGKRGQRTKKRSLQPSRRTDGGRKQIIRSEKKSVKENQSVSYPNPRRCTALLQLTKKLVGVANEVAQQPKGRLGHSKSSVIFNKHHHFKETARLFREFGRSNPAEAAAAKVHATKAMAYYVEEYGRAVKKRKVSEEVIGMGMPKHLRSVGRKK